MEQQGKKNGPAGPIFLCAGRCTGIILETAVGREKDVHLLIRMKKLDVHGRFEKLVVTLLVMRAFSNFPGALRACAYFRDPTAVSRIIYCSCNTCICATRGSHSAVDTTAWMHDVER